MIRIGPFEVFDEVVEVRASRRLAGVLTEALGDFPVSRRTASRRITVRQNLRGRWTVSTPTGSRYRGPDDHLALYDTLIAINEFAAATAASAGNVVLHGGSVAVGGNGVAFVGHSGAGKSTLTTAMVLAGHTYLADEVISVRTDNWVVRSFHRPVGIRPGGALTLGLAVPDGPNDTIYPFRVSTTGALAERAPLKLVLLLVRSPNGPARVEALDKPTALFKLANQTLGATDLEVPMFRRLEALVHAVPVAELHYSEQADAVRTVESALQGAATWSS